MITQEFLSQCNDEQINKGVAWLEASKLSIFDVEFDIPWRISEHEVISSYGRKFFSCHNPNDIMPIAESCCMSIEFPHPELGDTGQVSAYIHNDTDVCVEFNDMSKYMRAIAEVYILMSVNK